MQLLSFMCNPINNIDKKFLKFFLFRNFQVILLQNVTWVALFMSNSVILHRNN